MVGPESWWSRSRLRKILQEPTEERGWHAAGTYTVKNVIIYSITVRPLPLPRKLLKLYVADVSINHTSHSSTEVTSEEHCNCIIRSWSSLRYVIQMYSLVQSCSPLLSFRLPTLFVFVTNSRRYVMHNHNKTSLIPCTAIIRSRLSLAPLCTYAFSSR